MKTKQTGDFLKALRKAKGITQEELGDFLNVSNKTISKWENGLGLPEISTLLALADFYEVRVDDLLRGSKQTSTNIDVTQKQFQYLRQKSRHQHTNHLILAFSILVLGLLAFHIVQSLDLSRTAVLTITYGFIVLAVFVQSLNVNRVLYQHKNFEKTNQKDCRINYVYYFSLLLLFCSLWLLFFALFESNPWIHRSFQTVRYSSLMPAFSAASIITLILYFIIRVFIDTLKHDKLSILVKLVIIFIVAIVIVPLMLVNNIIENNLQTFVSSFGHYEWLYINNHEHLQNEIYGFMVGRGLFMLMIVIAIYILAHYVIRQKRKFY